MFKCHIITKETSSSGFHGSPLTMVKNFRVRTPENEYKRAMFLGAHMHCLVTLNLSIFCQDTSTDFNIFYLDLLGPSQ